MGITNKQPQDGRLLTKDIRKLNSGTKLIEHNDATKCKTKLIFHSLHPDGIRFHVYAIIDGVQSKCLRCAYFSDYGCEPYDDGMWNLNALFLDE